MLVLTENISVTLFFLKVSKLRPGLLWCPSSKESASQCRRHGLYPWVGKSPWRREWQPTPVFLPGKAHGQRNLVGYSTRGHKESDMTERLSGQNANSGKMVLWNTSLPSSRSLFLAPTTCLSTDWPVLQ